MIVLLRTGRGDFSAPQVLLAGANFDSRGVAAEP
jgi:hypothetical protein